MREHGTREYLGDRASRLRAADAVDAAASVPALEPQAVVEMDAEILEVDDSGGRLVRQRAHRALAAKSATRNERVQGMQLRRVAGVRRGGHSTLREPARRR